AAAAVFAGTALTGGHTRAAGPAADRPGRPDRPLVTEPGGILNPMGVLPGRLPEGKVEPIVFAFLDHCRLKSPKATTDAKGECAQWRLVGRSGKQWRLSDGIGSRVVKPRNYMNADAPLTISPDGWHIAYYRAQDQRLVVRDLTSGKVTPVSRSALPADVPQMMFSGDGSHLALNSAEPHNSAATLVDTRTGAVTPLRAGTVLGLSRDGSTVVQGDIRNKRAPLTVSGPDGSVRATVRLDPKVDLRGMAGNALSPDGRTLLTFSTRMDKAVLVDVRTGLITSVGRINGVVGGKAWTSPTTYFALRHVTRTPDPRAAKGTWPGQASQGVIVDLTTGAFRDVGMRFSIKAWQSAEEYGGYLS
ncbi:TolB family protein, partial [Actinomadura harenae]